MVIKIKIIISNIYYSPSIYRVQNWLLVEHLIWIEVKQREPGWYEVEIVINAGMGPDVVFRSEGNYKAPWEALGKELMTALLMINKSSKK